jgi:hypothetical protein
MDRRSSSVYLIRDARRVPSPCQSYLIYTISSKSRFESERSLHRSRSGRIALLRLRSRSCMIYRLWWSDRGSVRALAVTTFAAGERLSGCHSLRQFQSVRFTTRVFGAGGGSATGGISARLARRFHNRDWLFHGRFDFD